MKFVVAIPVYDGKLPAQTVKTLLSEQALAQYCGDEMQVRFLPSCSHPAMGRNQLAKEFLESNAERLFFLDSDVTCEPGSILKLLKHPQDFVGGAYRYKIDQESYPVRWVEGKDLWANEFGLLDVEAVPGGFLSLSRRVFEMLKNAHPDRTYEHQGVVAHAYFQMPFQDGMFFGEDYFFCHEWRALGEKVWLDPEVELTHWDFQKPYLGHIGRWLKSRLSEAA